MEKVLKVDDLTCRYRPTLEWGMFFSYELVTPKPGRRGRGRIQQARIIDSFTVWVAASVFQRLAPEEHLYSVDPATYRRKWDKLLEVLGIAPSLRLTPGGLRAGGYVLCYHNRVAVNDIL